MTKQPNCRFIGITAGMATLLLWTLSIPGVAQTDSVYTLVVQKTPVNGGIVTPEIGIHKFDINRMVTLTAMPRNGYRFLYWLGDVTDTNNYQTSVWLDSPKIVIAVFERTDFELPDESGLVGGVGIGEAVNHYADIRMGPAVSGVVSSGSSGHHYYPSNPEIPDNPVPEPATLAILAIGSLWIIKR
jgi:hypothetical protein